MGRCGVRLPEASEKSDCDRNDGRERAEIAQPEHQLSSTVRIEKTNLLLERATRSAILAFRHIPRRINPPFPASLHNLSACQQSETESPNLLSDRDSRGGAIFGVDDGTGIGPDDFSAAVDEWAA